MRRNALSIVFRKPSWVWVKEIAFVTLLIAASSRLSWDSSRLLTARPAASSDGVMILDPEDSRDSDLARALELMFRLLAVCWA